MTKDPKSPQHRLTRYDAALFNISSNESREVAAVARCVAPTLQQIAADYGAEGVGAALELMVALIWDERTADPASVTLEDARFFDSLVAGFLKRIEEQGIAAGDPTQEPETTQTVEVEASSLGLKPGLWPAKIDYRDLIWHRYGTHRTDDGTEIDYCEYRSIERPRLLLIVLND